MTSTDASEPNGFVIDDAGLPPTGAFLVLVETHRGEMAARLTMNTMEIVVAVAVVEPGEGIIRCLGLRHRLIVPN